ncbi:hypothetical protein [Ferdinandcohnia sp. Marseille-Q9671]
MYTYDSFETLGVFTLLRPILIMITIVLLLLLILVIIPKTRIQVLNGFSVVAIAFISVFVSAQVLFYEGILADELGLGGDSVSSYLFLVNVFLGVASWFLYFYIKNRRWHQKKE